MAARQPFLLALQTTLPADAFPWVAAALMHDTLVWASLHTAIGETALETLGSNPTAWHPGALARIALQQRADPTPDAPLPLPPKTLADAAVLAVGLQQYQQEHHGWHNLGAFLGKTPTAWQTAIACVMGWETHPAELLEALAALPDGVALAIDALLSQPLPPEIHLVRLAEFIQQVPVSRRASALALLRHRRPSLAQRVAAHLPPPSSPPPYPAWYAASRHIALGQPQAAQEALGQAWETLHHLQGEIAAQQARLAVQEGDLSTALVAWGQAAAYLPTDASVQAAYALTLHAARKTEEARALLPEHPTHPALQTAAAHILQDAHPEEARRLARQAAERLQHLDDTLLSVLAQTLYALGEHAQAAQAAFRHAQHRPTDADTLDIAADLALQARLSTEALETATLAYQQAPTADRLRRLARAQEQHGLFHEAKESLQRLLEREDATPEDHLALATLTFRLGEGDTALHHAQEVLKNHPQNAQALTLVGQVLAQQGQADEARRHLETAIAQHPDTPTPYLALAQVLEQSQTPEAALEILTQASETFPRDAEVHYQRGLVLLRMHRSTQARIALETAHHLAPQRTDIAHALAEALAALGEHTALCEFLTPFHQRRPTPKSAHLLAQAHLAEGRPAEAADLLRPLAEREDATPYDLYHYARAHLAADAPPAPAIAALQRALQAAQKEHDASFHLEVLIALGKAYAAQGDDAQALETYRLALQALPPDDAEHQRTIAKGLGRAALRLQRPEIALAALEHALQSHPNDPALRRLQTEAYHQLGFAPQVMDTGAQVVAAEDYAPDAALWYAQMLLSLGLMTEAALPLEQSLARHGWHPQVALLLSQVQQATRHTEQALEALAPFLHEGHTANAFSPSECAAAASQYLALNAAEAALTCIRRSLSAAAQPPAAWRLTLVRALQAQGHLDEATTAAQEALQQASEETDVATLAALHLAIVHNALLQAHPQQAQRALQRALEALPTENDLLREAVGLWRQMGNLPAALTAAEQALQQTPNDLALRLQTIHLSHLLLEPERAATHLETAPEPSSGQLPETLALWLATKAEHALAQGAEVAAAEHLTSALRYAPRSPRLQAIQARLAVRQGEADEARRFLAEAAERAPLPGDQAPLQTVATAESIAEAALELQDWPTARRFAEAIAQACPAPSSTLRMARLAVLVAEAADTCQAVAGRACLPPRAALEMATAEQWQNHLATAAQRMGFSATPEGYREHPILAQWYARGQAAFHNQTEARLWEHPWVAEDVAAALSAHRRRGRPAPGHPLPFATHPTVRFQHALLLEAQPQPDLAAAWEEILAARRARPHWAAAHALAARLGLHTGRLAEAAEAIGAALRLAPEEPRWHALAASIAQARGETHQALSHLWKAAQLEPAHLPHTFALAQALLETDNPREALPVLQSALSQFPHQPRLHLMTAQALFGLGRFSEAAHHAEKAAQAEETAEAAHALRIQIAMAEQDATRALEAAQQWLETHPHHPEATLYAARAWIALGKPKAALARIEETLPHAPQALELHILRAELQRQVHGPKAAVDTWRQLVAARPDAPRLWLGLAEALAEAGQTQSAEAAAHKALRAAEDLDLPTRARLHALVGNLAKDAGQLDQALFHLEQAALLTPKDVEVLLKLAQVQSERQQYHQALEILETCRRIAPQDSRPYYLAGLIYKAIRDYQNAEAMLRQAAQRAPHDFRIHRHLAIVSAINILPA